MHQSSPRRRCHAGGCWTFTVVVLLVLASSGCGSDTGASSEVPPGDDATVTGLSGDEQTAVAGLVASQKSEEEPDIYSAAAPCLATGFVDRFGIGWLQTQGMLREDLSGRRMYPTGVLTEQDAYAFYDVVLSCVDYRSLVATMVGGEEASMTDPYVARCVEAVTEDEVHEAFAAAVSDQDFHSTPFAKKLEKAGCGYEGD